MCYEALELEGKDVNIYNELGICLFSIGNASEAIEIFNEGININDSDYKIIFNRGGIAYLQLDQVEEAIKDINTAYRLNPNDVAVKKSSRAVEKALE